ncbi:hypothetical protein SLEP1_g33576 [Rubroshorea leprosula]|uniref:Uncharacterized protein n=1 Tax=Rubroshorea leprosula TaxID=152421 RepID=A0AAV5KH20_9ROSI|nr:hypothetical protein SLEP1_g33576 [Rubroshorea leprosula]
MMGYCSFDSNSRLQQQIDSNSRLQQQIDSSFNSRSIAAAAADV